MHVGVVLTNYPPHLGGVEAHAEALAREMVRAGHDVTVVCLGDRPGDEDRDGVRVLTLRRRADIGDVLAAPTSSDWRRAVTTLGGSGLTHVGVHTRYFPMTWLGLRLARRIGLPSILTEHGGGHVASASALVRAGARVVDHTMGRRALRTADRLLTVSAASADFVRRLAAREAAVIGNGCDAPFWMAAKAPPRRHLVFAGRLVGEKGWRDLLDCVTLGAPDVHATIAGDGPDRAALQRTVRVLGLERRVSVVGRLEREALREAYAGSVYVNPSRAAEGFQTTLLEAALSGSRIATYDVGGAAEVVSSGLAKGRVVGVGDVTALSGAITELLETSPQSTRDGLLRYDWPAVAARYLTELENAVPRGMP